MSSETLRPCPGCGENLAYWEKGTLYSKATLVEIRGAYDGGLFYAHVDGCGYAWHRWPEGSHLRDRAEFHLARWNQAREDKVDDKATD